MITPPLHAVYVRRQPQISLRFEETIDPGNPVIYEGNPVQQAADLAVQAGSRLYTDKR